MYYYRHIIGLFGGILVVIFANSNNLVIGSLSSPGVENQEPEQITAQITQAREAIENELKKQGEIMTNAIKEQFGFENVQSKRSNQKDLEPHLSTINFLDLVQTRLFNSYRS